MCSNSECPIDGPGKLAKIPLRFWSFGGLPVLTYSVLSLSCQDQTENFLKPEESLEVNFFLVLAGGLRVCVGWHTSQCTGTAQSQPKHFTWCRFSVSQFCFFHWQAATLIFQTVPLLNANFRISPVVSRPSLALLFLPRLKCLYNTPPKMYANWNQFQPWSSLQEVLVCKFPCQVEAGIIQH